MTWGMSNWWDCTVPKKDVNYKALIEWMEKTGERWVIGEEEGAGGYKHFQIRICFKNETTIDALRYTIPTGHWTPTQVRDFEYIYKEGSYLCSWDKILAKYLDLELRPWQSNAYNRFLLQNERQILCIIDKVGNTGKSYLARHLVAKRLARLLPTSDDARNLVQYAMAETAGGYIIDVPRRGTLKKGFWEGIEQIKGGHLYETRYAFSEKWIEPPKVMVMTNTRPSTKELSADRWDFMELTKDNEGSLNFTSV